MHAYIFPWIDLQSPITILDFEILPHRVAVAEAGPFGPALAKATSYFFENSRRASFDNGEPELVPVAPSIILLENDSEVVRASRAADCWFLASMLDSRSDKCANSTLFIQFHQRLSLEHRGFRRDSRYLFGTRHLATDADYSIEVKPFWCGQYCQPNNAMLRLCEQTIESPEADPVRRAVTALHMATSDMDMMDRHLEHSMYALALERLLRRDDQSRHNRVPKQAKLAKELLDDVLLEQLMVRDDLQEASVSFPSDNYAMVRAMKWIRDDRNLTVHSGEGPKSPLADQLVLRPNLVAFRVVMALIILTLQRCAPSPSLNDPLLKSFVAATEHWAGEVESLVSDGTAEAVIGRFSRLWSRYFTTFSRL